MRTSEIMICLINQVSFRVNGKVLILILKYDYYIVIKFNRYCSDIGIYQHIAVWPKMHEVKNSLFLMKI